MKKLIKKILLKKGFAELIFLVTNALQDLLNFIIKVFKRTKNKGVILLTFDDGLISVYENAYPIMKKYNVVGNIAVIINKIGTPGYMNITQLKELQDMGWGIVSHTMNHPDLSSLAEEQIIYELKESKKWLQENEFLGFNSFIVPFHYHNALSEKLINETYSISRGNSHKGMKFLGRFGLYLMPNYPLKDKLLIPSLPIEDFMNFNNGFKKVKKYISFSIQSAKFGALYTHGLNPNDKVIFEKLINVMASNKQHIITYPIIQNLIAK